MATYYAAVDMGASSGRLILGHMENGKIELEEIHRLKTEWLRKTASSAGNLTVSSKKS